MKWYEKQGEIGSLGLVLCLGNDRDHLQSNMGIISGPVSFAVQFGDHLQSGIICCPACDHLRTRTVFQWKNTT